MSIPVIGMLAGLLLLGFIYEEVSRHRAQRYPLPGRLVDVGGYRLHVTDSGDDGPVVVIIAGAGESSYSWLTVRRQVAKFTRVVAYDRPGLGSSEEGPGADAVGSLTELQKLMTKVGVTRPCVLVGHSLGGLLARMYAIKYPEQVAGLVLVDSTHEFTKDDPKFRQGMAAVAVLARISRALAPVGLFRFLGQVLNVMPMYPERRFFAQQLSREEYDRWAAIGYRNLASENAGKEISNVYAILEEASRQMKGSPEAPQFGDMPLAVLTNPGFGEGWIAMHRELANRSSNSIHVISDQKGHSLQMPRPDLVVDAIRHVVEQVRSRADEVS